MRLGNETKVTADLTVEPSCPCCGSQNYLATMSYDADGLVTGKTNACLDCRDNLCEKCKVGPEH